MYMGMLTEIIDPTQDALFSLTEQSVKSSLYITGAKSLTPSQDGEMAS